MFDPLEDQIEGSQMQFEEFKPNSVETRMDSSDPTVVIDHTKNKYDNADFKELQRLLMSYYLTEVDIQSRNRADQETDEDFYDNEQWTSIEKQTLEERGQDPLVFNVIQTTINWVLGTERRARTDYKILPRRKDGSKAAERKTELTKYLSDVNHTPFHISRAFADVVKVGVGWLECGFGHDTDQEPVYDRYESWRNVLHDSAAVELDMKDGRYIFRTKFVDEDIAISYFPERGELIRAARDVGYEYGSFLDRYGDEAMDSLEDHLTSGYGSNPDDNKGYFRNRVRLIECWFRTPKKVDIMRGGDFAGEIFDGASRGHAQDIEEGRAEIVSQTKMRVQVVIMTTNAILYAGDSPYRHNKFPLTPIFGHRRGRDGLPYGLIRVMRDIQTDINKNAAKARFVLATNKTIMDDGAVPDLDEYAEEVARPDGIIVKNQGKELVINADRELSPAHLSLMSNSISMLQQQSGVTDENLGRSTNATSGKAIIARQDQGSLATAIFFDNLRFAVQIHGEKRLSLIEQFFSEKKSFRITNQRGTPEFIDINDDLPENDITRTKADFIMAEEEWRSTIRQAQSEALIQLMMQLAGTAPQIVMGMLDILVESMDVPMRDELVRRIRQVTGYEDPDADPNEKTPEQLAKEQAQAMEQQMQMRAAEAEIAGKEADVRETMAKANKVDADAQKILAAIPGENIEAQRKALEAAMQIIAAPRTVPVADGMLREAGYKGAQPPAPVDPPPVPPSGAQITPQPIPPRA